MADLPNLGDIRSSWSSLSVEDRQRIFVRLPRSEAEELFLHLSPADKVDLLQELPTLDKRSWLRLLPPDDAADVIQELDAVHRTEALGLLDDQTRREVTALLAYAEDEAGGLMNSRFLRLRPEISADEAIRYLRVQAKAAVDPIYYAYVLDVEQHLLGIVSFRELFLAPPDKTVAEVMRRDVISIPEEMDQEEVSRQFSLHHLMALPVLDKNKHMKGIVTVNDIVDVVEEEATEDFQKLGGVIALEAPYMQMNLWQMIQKRAGWLTILFVSEMFTATAMAYYETEIARAVVLALFIPLIISSGGNSGSQASSLIIRALALKEARLRDWWRVLGKEIASGFILGAILGSIGFTRIMLWPTRDIVYGEHYFLVAITVSVSLIGVVLWGSIMGAMLPFMLRSIRLDPATASAPLVATLVDVTGIAIYFTIASIVLRGTLL